jgi:hypothetical protein
MYMVWHHCPSSKFIEVPLAFPDQNRTGHKIGNARVIEP